MPAGSEPLLPLDAYERASLIEAARTSVRHGLAAGEPPAVDLAAYGPALRAEGATFVTLQREGRLRGCIGALEPRWPLVVDAVRHAFAAAFTDPRFPPIARSEYAELTIHLSVLSRPEPLPFSSESELLASLRPGLDGLVLHYRDRRATFLPTVWETLLEPDQFLHELKRKAGIPPDLVPERAERYRAQSFGET